MGGSEQAEVKVWRARKRLVDELDRVLLALKTYATRQGESSG